MTIRRYEAGVRDRYDELASAYIDLFSDTSTAHPLDRALFSAFASLIPPAKGPVADLGCGPGQWTRHLHDLGLDVFGVDLTPAFLVEARTRHPNLRFIEGSIADLDLVDGALAGVVAWFSLIHTPPDELPTLLTEVARVLAPGGVALVGFQSTDVGSTQAQPFDHAVVTGYRWPIDLMSARLRAANLVETAHAKRRPTESERFPAGYLIATKVCS